MKTSMQLEEIIRELGAEAEHNGQAAGVIRDVCALDDAVEGGITFCTKTSPLTVKAQIEKSKASAFLVSSKLKGKFDIEKAVIFVNNPLESFVKLVTLFRPISNIEHAISSRAEIHPSAKIGKNVAIGAFSVVGANVVIEDDAVLHSHVTLYSSVHIGKRTIIHAGAVIRENCRVGADCTVQNGVVIGAEGFGYFLNSKNELQAVPQVGAVVIERGVDIGANTCIDRATLGLTKIGTGTKVDNLVQIAHNVQMGSNCIVCGQGGIAGSAKIGNYVTLGAGVGVGDHVKICDGARFSARAGVSHDIEVRADYGGTPAVPITTWRRMMVGLKRLGQKS